MGVQIVLAATSVRERQDWASTIEACSRKVKTEAQSLPKPVTSSRVPAQAIFDRSEPKVAVTKPANQPTAAPVTQAVSATPAAANLAAATNVVPASTTAAVQTKATSLSNIFSQGDKDSEVHKPLVVNVTMNDFEVHRVLGRGKFGKVCSTQFLISVTSGFFC
jgi:hypothetical protein